jgi:hypothetical protein
MGPLKLGVGLLMVALSILMFKRGPASLCHLLALAEGAVGLLLIAVGANNMVRCLRDTMRTPLESDE